jgi:hypothetical protein
MGLSVVIAIYDIIFGTLAKMARFSDLTQTFADETKSMEGHRSPPQQHTSTASPQKFIQRSKADSMPLHVDKFIKIN